MNNKKPVVVVMPEDEAFDHAPEHNLRGAEKGMRFDIGPAHTEEFIQLMRDTRPSLVKNLRKQLRREYITKLRRDYVTIIGHYMTPVNGVFPWPGDKRTVLFLTNCGSDERMFDYCIKGDPRPTPVCDLAALKRMQIVGVYRPADAEEQADPKNDGKLYQWKMDGPHPDHYNPECRIYRQPDGTERAKTLTVEEYREFASGYKLLPAVLSKMTHPLMVGFYKPIPSKCVVAEDTPIIIGG